MKRIHSIKIELNFYLNHLNKTKEFKEIVEILEKILGESNDTEAIRRDSKAIQDAIPTLLQLVEQKNSQSIEAAFLLGMIYSILRDDKRAFEYLQRAVNSGHAPALTELGHYYSMGIGGVSQDSKQAFEHYRLSATQKWGPGLFFLGRAYHYGYTVRSDAQIAILFYIQAVNLDYLPALNNLAFFYLHGFGVEQNSNRALDLFRSAADKGLGTAQANLAELYLFGSGIKQDIEQGHKYNRMALAQKYPTAQFNLANCYSKGKGVLIDSKRDIELSILSAGQKHSSALHHLASSYLLGIGTIPNFERAILLFRVTMNTHMNSLNALVDLYGGLTNIPHFKDFIYGIYKSAFIFDNVTLPKNCLQLELINPLDDKVLEALTTIAFCFQMGLCDEQDFERAEQLYLRAIELYKKKDNPEAISRLHWDLYFCYQIQNQRINLGQIQTEIEFDSKTLSVFHEKLKLSVSEGNFHDLELLGYMNERNDLNLEGNWYAAVQCYQQYFNHFQKELKEISAVTDTNTGTTEKERKQAKEEPTIELEMDEDWRKSLEGLRSQESKKTPKELLQRKVAYSSSKLEGFMPFLKLKDEIETAAGVNSSIAALIVAYAKDTDVQKEIKL